ncbi:MAG TPA: polysaccharide deacetylase family protein [Myxococcales bacterium]|nr:polysaccharide deacetylase family protein [Myxococcales bacterium]
MIWSVSVDLDGLGCYAAIHGLSLRLDGPAQRAVPEVAVQRFCELFEALGVRATFFVIGRDAGIAPARLRAAAGAGHEIASHSYAHDYALSRRTREEIAQDLALAERAIEDACGSRPRGFRAPGYTLSPELLDAVRERAYAYDSSLLPSPPYYAAKAAALAVYALRGRRSQSILGGLRQLFAPRGPHRRRGVRELPVATLPGLRAPVIGTTVLPFPWLARRAFAGGHLNLELHGIDALDATDVPQEIAAAQPGLRMRAAEKLRRLRRVLETLPGDHRTLEAAAIQLLP